MTRALVVLLAEALPAFAPAETYDAAFERLEQGRAYGTEKTGAFTIGYPFRGDVEFAKVGVP